MDWRILKDIFRRNMMVSIEIYFLAFIIPLFMLSSKYSRPLTSIMLGLPMFVFLLVKFNEINPLKTDREMIVLPIPQKNVVLARWLMLFLFPLFLMILFLAALALIAKNDMHQSNAIAGVFINTISWISIPYILLRLAELTQRNGYKVTLALKSTFQVIIGSYIGLAIYIFAGLNTLWIHYPNWQPLLAISAIVLLLVSFSLTQIHSLPLQVPRPLVQEIITQKPCSSYKISFVDRCFASPRIYLILKFLALTAAMSILIIPSYLISHETHSYGILLYMMIVLMITTQYLIPIRLHVSLPLSRRRIFWDYFSSLLLALSLSFLFFILICLFVSKEAIDFYLIGLMFSTYFYSYFLMNAMTLEFKRGFPQAVQVITIPLVIIASLFIIMDIDFILWGMSIILTPVSPIIFLMVLARSSNPYKQTIAPM